jgi:hypothetical protein
MVTQFFNEIYEGRYIRRRPPVAWPSWSPDINPLYFFLWGFLKLRVYHGDKQQVRHQLLEAIDEAAVGV